MLNLLDNANAVKLLQRNAGTIERYEWRREQSEVKPSPQTLHTFN
jgi:hypothetical protein